MANTLMHSAMVEAHALRGKGGRACHCCSPLSAGDNSEKNRQAVRQRMRQIENREWKKDQD